MLEKLEYPLDIDYIMRKRKQIKKLLLEKKDFIEKKVAILGGSTTFDLKEILDLFLLKNGIKAIFYESDYNKYYEEAFFGGEIDEFQPDIVYIHTTFRNITYVPNILESDEKNKENLEKEYEKFKTIWQKLDEKFNCIIIQNNFDYPKYRPHGNLERTLTGGIINFIDQLNIKISEYSLENKNFLINDINYLSSLIGLEKWHDYSMWYRYKYSFSFEAIPSVAQNIANIIKAKYGKIKKCLVLDLDNTLWGGVIGDDGVNNIKIGKEDAVSEAYFEFQKYIKELKNRGITLAISSKNDMKNAKEGLNHPEMYLKEEDFQVIKANWDPKFINIDNIAKEINIGLDSLVFIDDNPAEREIVKNNLSDVEVPDVGNEVLNFIEHIDRNGYFEITGISEEDTKRNEYYKLNRDRKNLEKSFKNYEEFLLSLEMIAEINEFKPIYLDRITQLTNKTNQFNLTTKRYSLNEIEAIYNEKNTIGIYGRLKDKFGDNGLVSIIIGSIENNNLHIDLWLMSCRVLKRNMEEAMFDSLIDICKIKKIDKIYGYYYKTSKNEMVKKHYETLGFNLIIENEKEKKYEININDIEQKKNEVIKIGEY